MERSIVPAFAALLVAASLGTAFAVPAARPTLLSGEPPADLPVPPRRIVSVNLPTDEVLLALLPAHDLLAVSAFADDPQVSNVVELARGVPHRVRADVETILALEPGVVLTFPFSRPETQSLLASSGVPVVHVPNAGTLDGVRALVRRLGALVGKRTDAEDLLHEMDAKLARAGRRAARAGRSPARALLWHEGAYTAGCDSFFDELARIAGAINVACAELGLRGVAPLDLEEIVRVDPEWIFTIDYRADARTRDVARSDVTSHAALRDVRAMRNDHIVPLRPNAALSSSHHVAEMAVEIADALYGPESIPRSITGGNGGQ